MTERTGATMPSTTAQDVSHARMPAAAKLAVIGGVAALLGGTAVLLALRGEALILDLSALGGRIFCL